MIQKTRKKPDLRLPVVFVGDPSDKGCECMKENKETSPNNVPGADAMINMIGYGLASTITNPFATNIEWNPNVFPDIENKWDRDRQLRCSSGAWYDVNGNEAGDKCRFIFGETYETDNGAKANLILHGRDYLVQNIWDNRKLCCDVNYDFSYGCGDFVDTCTALNGKTFDKDDEPSCTVTLAYGEYIDATKSGDEIETDFSIYVEDPTTGEFILLDTTSICGPDDLLFANTGDLGLDESTCVKLKFDFDCRGSGCEYEINGFIDRISKNKCGFDSVPLSDKTTKNYILDKVEKNNVKIAEAKIAAAAVETK